MLKLISSIDKVSRYLSYLAALALIVGVIASCYEVFVRYILSKPTLWSGELVQILFGAIFLLCVGDNIRTRSHVAIDFVQSLMSSTAKNILGASVYFILCIYAAIFLSVVWKRSWDSILILETSNTPWDPPIWPLSVLLLVAVASLFFQSLIGVVRSLKGTDPDFQNNDTETEPEKR